MSNLFEVSTGITLDGVVDIIYGDGVPGLSVESNQAPIGSSYNNVTDGSTWQKTRNEGGNGDWVELAGKDAAIRLEGVSSAAVVIDSIPTHLADQFIWGVTGFEVASPNNKFALIINASHNGTDVLDATALKFGQSSKLQHGAKIVGCDVAVSLAGNGSNQVMNLLVSAVSPVTFTAYRLVKNQAGSSSVVLGQSEVNNHVIDGSMHLTTWQNDLLDALNTSLKASEVNALVGVTSNIQAQLNSKLSEAPPSAYDLVASTWGAPAAAEVIFRMRSARAFTIPATAGQANAQAKAGVAATGACSFALLKNGSAVGTISFGAGATTGTVTIGAGITVAVGDLLAITAPATADATLGDVDLTIIGNL